MKNNRFLKIVIIVLLIINIGTLSYLWINRPKPFRHNRPPHNAFHFLKQKLNLNQQQAAQYQNLQNELHQKMEGLQQRDRQLHHQFFNLLKGNASDSAVQVLADSIAENQKQIELATFYHFQKIQSLLTPKQKQQFNAIIQHTLRMMAPKRPPGPPPPR